MSASSKESKGNSAKSKQRPTSVTTSDDAWGAFAKLSPATGSQTKKVTTKAQAGSLPAAKVQFSLTPPAPSIPPAESIMPPVEKDESEGPPAKKKAKANNTIVSDDGVGPPPLLMDPSPLRTG